MIEKIKSELFKQYKNDDIRWLFFSLFDNNNKLLVSNWVIKTDKTLDQLLDTFYSSIISKYSGSKIIVIDLVKDLIQEIDVNKILQYSMKEYGFCLIDIDNQKTWVILPDTHWIKDIKDAFSNIKKKNNIWSKVDVYSFKTDRIVISI